jgi:hypothetical protein
MEKTTLQVPVKELEWDGGQGNLRVGRVKAGGGGSVSDLWSLCGLGELMRDWK